MKVADLSDAKLDMWAAKAEDYVLKPGSNLSRYKVINAEGDMVGSIDLDPDAYNPFGRVYSPSTDWSQGGPIIERERICVAFFENELNDREAPEWRAEIVDGEGYFTSLDLRFSGPTYLVAAIRCYVASKFGEEVPDE